MKDHKNWKPKKGRVYYPRGYQGHRHKGPGYIVRNSEVYFINEEGEKKPCSFKVGRNGKTEIRIKKPVEGNSGKKRLKTNEKKFFDTSELIFKKKTDKWTESSAVKRYHIKNTVYKAKKKNRNPV